jgi:cysteine synthase B
MILSSQRTLPRTNTRLWAYEPWYYTGQGRDLGSRDMLIKKSGWGRLYYAESVCNDDNWKAHYKTTGPNMEWYRRNCNTFVAAMGTTGIMGTSLIWRKTNNSNCRCNQRLTDSWIRKWPQEYLPKIFDASKVDRVIEVSESEARAMTKRLALEEAFCRNEQRRISCNYCENCRNGIRCDRCYYVIEEIVIIWFIWLNDNNC